MNSLQEIDNVYRKPNSYLKAYPSESSVRDSYDELERAVSLDPTTNVAPYFIISRQLSAFWTLCTHDYPYSLAINGISSAAESLIQISGNLNLNAQTIC